MKNITFEQLKEMHGDDAGSIWQQILSIGGFGYVETNYPGGLDIGGLPDASRSQIEALIKKKSATAAKQESN